MVINHLLTGDDPPGYLPGRRDAWNRSGTFWMLLPYRCYGHGSLWCCTRYRWSVGMVQSSRADPENLRFVTYFLGGLGVETGVIGCGLAKKEILDFWGQESEIGGGGGGLFIVVCALLCFLIAGWVRIAFYYCSFLVQRWNDVIIG